jgi:hypothetical protein
MRSNVKANLLDDGVVDTLVSRRLLEIPWIWSPAEFFAFRQFAGALALAEIRSAHNGLGRSPVCNPVSVAEHLFAPMRCELDEDRPPRHTEEFDADVDDRSA